MIMEQVLFVVNNSLVILIATMVSEMTMRDREPWRRRLALLSLCPVIILFTVLLLGCIGQLRAGPAAFLLAVAAVAVAVRQRSYYHKDSLYIAVAPNSSPGGVARKIAYVIGLAVFGLFLGLLAGRFLIRGTHFHWDDLSYHATFAAHWIADGRVSVHPYLFFAYYPFNAEILSLWLMLPFKNDAFVSMAGFYWGALMAFSVFGLGSAKKHSKTGLYLTVVLILCSPVLLRSINSFTAVDLAGPAALMAAIAFAIPSYEGNAYSARFVDAVYCGLLAGLAVGCKVSMAPVCFILLLWLLLYQRKSFSGWVRLAFAGIFVVCMIATGAFWFIRNAVLTGNPLFPAEMGPFSGPLAAEAQARTKLISWIIKNPTDFHQWRDLIQEHLNWPVGTGLLCVLGYLSGTCVLVKQNRAYGDRLWVLFLLLTSGLTLFFLYPFMPYSGTSHGPTRDLWVQPRYIIASFVIGIVLFCSLLKNRNTFWLCLAIIVLATTPEIQLDEHMNAVAFGGLLTAYFAWTTLGKIVPASIHAKRCLLIIAPAALGGLAICLSGQEKATKKHLYDYSHLGGSWEAIEGLPAGSRITWFGNWVYQYYPLFGRHLQLDPVRVYDDGSLYKQPHCGWEDNIEYDDWVKAKIPMESNLLIPNLISSRIEYVVVTQGSNNQWPPQKKVLAASGKLEKIYDDGYSVIWRMKRSGLRSEPPN